MKYTKQFELLVKVLHTIFIEYSKFLMHMIGELTLYVLADAPVDEGYICVYMRSNLRSIIEKASTIAAVMKIIYTQCRIRGKALSGTTVGLIVDAAG